MKIELKEIHFFKKENDADNFIEQEKLQVINDKELISRSSLQNLIDLINRYFSGQNIELFEMLKEIGIELNIQEVFPTTFSQNVIRRLLSLKFGEVTTYSQIGEEIGSKAYRVIGNVCRSNPIPLVIPCHRVLRKNGEIGGFMGKSDKTWETNLKKQLLKIEGYREKKSILHQSKLI